MAKLETSINIPDESTCVFERSPTSSHHPGTAVSLHIFCNFISCTMHVWAAKFNSMFHFLFIWTVSFKLTLAIFPIRIGREREREVLDSCVTVTTTAPATLCRRRLSSFSLFFVPITSGMLSCIVYLFFFTRFLSTAAEICVQPQPSIATSRKKYNTKNPKCLHKS